MHFKIMVWLVGACMAWPVAAQTETPSAEQMIEQLKAPRTRGLRNLIIEAAPAPSDAPSDAPAVAAPAASAATAPASSAPPPRPSLSLMIQFDFNSARVRPESRQALANLSLALQSPGLVDSRFAVEGHTDARGNAAANVKLSQQRAQAVRAFLTAQGVAPSRLVATGKGATELANSLEPFAAENRRVRIVNLD